MFWTDCLVQKTMFGGDEYRTSSTISDLIAFAKEAFPEQDCNFHRTVAFLTHYSTQNFMRPILVSYFGTLDNAKVPTMEWLERLGSFETLARSTRSNSGNGNASSCTKSSTPSWYSDYGKTANYRLVKQQAEEFWTRYMGQIHCSVNARHQYEVLHHSDYGRMGEADEFRYLVPLCNDCHASISVRGPRVPAAVPEGVKRWL